MRVLAPFAAHTQDGRHLEHLLGPDWLLDVTDLVLPHAHVQDPRVASLEGGPVLVGREPGVTAIEVSRVGGRAAPACMSGKCKGAGGTIARGQGSGACCGFRCIGPQTGPLGMPGCLWRAGPRCEWARVALEVRE